MINIRGAMKVIFTEDKVVKKQNLASTMIDRWWADKPSIKNKCRKK